MAQESSHLSTVVAVVDGEPGSSVAFSFRLPTNSAAVRLSFAHGPEVGFAYPELSFVEGVVVSFALTSFADGGSYVLALELVKRLFNLALFTCSHKRKGIQDYNVP